jgi:magnesium transporter
VRRNRLHRAGRLEREDFDCAQISELREQGDTVVRLDLDAPDEQDLAMVADEFGLSRLAARDLVRVGRRATVTRHDQHLLMTLSETRIDGRTAEFVASEMGVVVGDRWLVTM